MTIRFSEMPPSEQLAVKQALFSRLGDDVSTKNPDSLRHAADVDMIATYNSTGYKSRDVMVNGQKVGTHSVRIGKGREAQTRKRLVVKDPYAFDAYVKEQAMDEALEYIHLMMDNFAAFMLETYGVVPDGCSVVEDTTPAQPPTVQGTTLRIDPDKVADAISGYLSTGVAMLLGGGENGN